MAQPELRFARKDYDALPEGMRVELIKGAREVWLLDPDEKTAEVKTPGGTRSFRGTLESEAVPGFRMALAPAFRRE